MEIQAITMAASQLPRDTTPTSAAAVEASKVEAFARALFGRDNQTPESALLHRFQEKSLAINADLDGGNRSATAIANDPVEMLAAQSDILRASMEVDLAAKVAGSISQGVNKLVSMA